MGGISIRQEVPCELCGKKFITYHQRNLCEKCVKDKKIRKHLIILEQTFNPKSKYNQHLFNLYLKYICRFKLCYHQLVQAKRLKFILESTDLPPFASWNDIYRESKSFRKKHVKTRNSGCPFVKIAHMLQELGVLAPKSEEMGPYFQRLFNRLSEDSLSKIKPFIDHLQTTAKAQTTMVRTLEILVLFDLWMLSEVKANLLMADSILIQRYFDHLITQSGCKYSSIQQIFPYLKMYYRWCKSKKMIFNNPCEGIKINARPPGIIICSELQCDNFFAFIKNPNSNPEQALMIALILIWGLKSEDLCFAKFDLDGDTLKITLRRKQLTKRRHCYNREQTLKLPTHPQWFHQLQKRFYQDWLNRYGRLKKTYPQYYLILPKSRFVRPVNRFTLLLRIYESTVAAVGERIPARVLRKTCGHLHTVKNDASILSRLGWCTEYSFDYSWMPRSYFSRNK